MRINKFLARATGLSRRAADLAVQKGRVTVNGRTAELGTEITPADTVTLDGKRLELSASTRTIMLNKPAGYICSRRGQGGRTVYELLPPEFHHLKTVGRLDKDSSGLLLLTDDGELAERLTHPRYDKEKTYEVELDRALAPADVQRLELGVQLEDGPSRLQVKYLKGHQLTVVMTEGRNRQIRRTFAALGYEVRRLHRTRFGDYELGDLRPGSHQPV